MVAKRDYYDVLGVTKTSSHHEVKQQYRKLALKFHPDRNPSSESGEHFKEISEAYAVISDPQKKQVYDQHGHAGVDGRYSNEDIFQGTQRAGFDFNDVWGWRNKGLALYFLGKYEEAIKCYDKAIEIDPNDADVWNNKGDSMDSLGKYEEAITSYDKAIEIDPNDADVWNNKGDSMDSLGNNDEAKKCYDKSKELGHSS